MSIQNGVSIGLQFGVSEGTVGIEGSNVGVELNGLCVFCDSLLVLLV